LLGSVSGGQASNLFTLLAGGDVALSIVCTVSLLNCLSWVMP
jgi:predicted Na+-dependent transporter